MVIRHRPGLGLVSPHPAHRPPRPMSNMGRLRSTPTTGPGGRPHRAHLDADAVMVGRLRAAFNQVDDGVVMCDDRARRCSATSPPPALGRGAGEILADQAVGDALLLALEGVSRSGRWSSSPPCPAASSSGPFR